MKYSSHNLNDPDIRFPLRSPCKILVEYRPGGVYLDHAPMFYSADPEGEVDVIVRQRGWDRQPGYTPADVWVDGGF